MPQTLGYNERLFSGGLRGTLHYARFIWIRDSLVRLGCSPRSVLELGCFDGKLIDFLPQRPVCYVGFDAGWEGGLDIAAKRWTEFPQFSFRRCERPEEMRLLPEERFDIGVAMETLEHVPPAMLDGYLVKLARHAREYVFITVPNEKGPLFLAKWTAKKLLGYTGEEYSLADIANATLCRMEKIVRQDHKGFDYAQLLREADKHFEIVSVTGFPFGILPIWACLSVGIIGKPRSVI